MTSVAGYTSFPSAALPDQEAVLLRSDGGHVPTQPVLIADRNTSSAPVPQVSGTPSSSQTPAPSGQAPASSVPPVVVTVPGAASSQPARGVPSSLVPSVVIQLPGQSQYIPPSAPAATGVPPVVIPSQPSFAPAAPAPVAPAVQPATPPATQATSPSPSSPNVQTWLQRDTSCLIYAGASDLVSAADLYAGPLTPLFGNPDIAPSVIEATALRTVLNGVGSSQGLFGKFGVDSPCDPERRSLGAFQLEMGLGLFEHTGVFWFGQPGTSAYGMDSETDGQANTREFKFKWSFTGPTWASSHYANASQVSVRHHQYLAQREAARAKRAGERGSDPKKWTPEQLAQAQADATEAAADADLALAFDQNQPWILLPELLLSGVGFYKYVGVAGNTAATPGAPLASVNGQAGALDRFGYVAAMTSEALASNLTQWRTANGLILVSSLTLPFGMFLVHPDASLQGLDPAAMRGLVYGSMVNASSAGLNLLYPNDGFGSDYVKNAHGGNNSVGWQDGFKGADGQFEFDQPGEGMQALAIGGSSFASAVGLGGMMVKYDGVWERVAVGMAMATQLDLVKWQAGEDGHIHLGVEGPQTQADGIALGLNVSGYLLGAGIQLYQNSKESKPKAEKAVLGIQGPKLELVASQNYTGLSLSGRF